MLSLQIALRYVVARKRPMAISLLGIVFGIAFFVLTQAQTSGFEAFFIRTILGTNGAIRVSDQFQDVLGTVHQEDEDGNTRFMFHAREDAIYREGIDQPELLRGALKNYSGITGISEIVEGHGLVDTGTRKSTVEILGIKLDDHLQVSELGAQMIDGTIQDFSLDPMGVLLGSKVFQRLNLKVGDRVYLAGETGNRQFRVSGVFETGVSQIDKKRIYLHLPAARSFLGRPFGGAVFQIGLVEPGKAPEIAAHLQSFLHHRVVSWQEREQVWLEVFKALRISSAITVSSILLLSGLGIFNVFAIMVMEKSRDIAILRSMGFSCQDVSAIFLWQGGLVLGVGILLGSLLGASCTFLVSVLPLRIRGIFTADHFVVNWDPWHYLWAALIALIFVSVATWIPARRASSIVPAKIIRASN